ncbi:hypothetical protein [Lysobacter fragariae]
MPTQAHDPASEDALDGTRNAVFLAATHATLLAMTPRQRDVFRQLCCLQMDDAGPHALLPHVVAGFLAVSSRPWWDHNVAGLPDESEAPARR